MKKLIYALLFVPVVLFSQERKVISASQLPSISSSQSPTANVDTKILADKEMISVPIKNYVGVEITGKYKLTREKPGKKEYEIHVVWKNTTDKEIFYKVSSLDYFGKVKVNGIGGAICSLTGDKVKQKILKSKIKILYPGKEYEDVYFVQWYNESEVPGFTFEVNPDVTLENDYDRYKQ